VSDELSSLASSSFWEGGQEAVENDDVVEMRNATMVGPEQEKEWETAMYRALESLKAVAVVDGCVTSFFLCPQ
jgi:hypothetical protein